jgi:ankyrin repeat protein
MIPLQARDDTAKRHGWKVRHHFRAGWLILCLLLTLAGSFPAQGAEIHKAVVKGNLNKVAALLKDHPEQLESKNDLGRTPLHLAVIHNELEIADLLLANGADVNARDPDQHTPLIWTLWIFNHDKMMRLLLAKGADVNLSDRWGMTALAYAAKLGQIDDAKILLIRPKCMRRFWVSYPRCAFVFAARVRSVSLTSKGRINNSERR